MAEWLVLDGSFRRKLDVFAKEGAHVWRRLSATRVVAAVAMVAAMTPAVAMTEAMRAMPGRPHQARTCAELDSALRNDQRPLEWCARNHFATPRTAHEQIARVAPLVHHGSPWAQTLSDVDEDRPCRLVEGKGRSRGSLERLHVVAARSEQ